MRRAVLWLGLLGGSAIGCSFDSGGGSAGADGPDASGVAVDAAGGDGTDGGGGGADAGGFDAAFVAELVEHMVIPTEDAPVVTSETTLALGVTYELRASGTMVLSDEQNLTADAEYWWFDATPGSTNNSAIIGDGSVDIGLAINDAVIDEVTNPDWGAYAADHVYSVQFVGEGDTIDAQYHDLNASNNSGDIALDIYTTPN